MLTSTSNQVILPLHYRIAKLWIRGLIVVSSATLLGIISILIGINVPAETPPIISFVHLQPLLSLGGGIILVTITFISFILSRGQIGANAPNFFKNNQSPSFLPLLVSSVISTVSTLLFVSLLVIVLNRPSWCPTTICPAPQAITNPAGIHDANIDLSLTAFQSNYYVLQSDPSSYNIDTLPKKIGAVRIDQNNPNDLYRVALNAHNLNTSKYDLIIEQVNLLVHSVPSISKPLNVWMGGSNADYHSNLYQLSYSGELAGSEIPANFAASPFGYVQLMSGEADELDIQINSKVPVDLQYQVNITYRLANKAQLYSLTFPQIFEVVFSDSTNWHVYAF